MSDNKRWRNDRWLWAERRSHLGSYGRVRSTVWCVYSPVHSCAVPIILFCPHNANLHTQTLFHKLSLTFPDFFLHTYLAGINWAWPFIYLFNYLATFGVWVIKQAHYPISSEDPAREFNSFIWVSWIHIETLWKIVAFKALVFMANRGGSWLHNLWQNGNLRLRDSCTPLSFSYNLYSHSSIFILSVIFESAHFPFSKYTNIILAILSFIYCTHLPEFQVMHIYIHSILSMQCDIVNLGVKTSRIFISGLFLY